VKLSGIWSAVEALAREQGAMRIGACELSSETSALFAEWLDRGSGEGMDYLKRHLNVRWDPLARYPWAKSAIVISVPYSSRRGSDDPQTIAGTVARYAQGDDYHEVLDGMLQAIEARVKELAPDAKTWRYVDTGPLSDRDLAVRAGLGWIGKNAMLIDQQNGSYFFIGSLLTSIENDLQFDYAPDRCGSCTRCIEACPTKAILPDRTVHSPDCISYLTIEHRGDLPPDRAQQLAGNAFGCDICQEVCPWNGEPADGHPAFAPRSEYSSLPVTALLQMEQSTFSTLFRKSAVKRAKLAGMRRNAEALSLKPPLEASPRNGKE
jgi:epoxyqueuosine reductase